MMRNSPTVQDDILGLRKILRNIIPNPPCYIESLINEMINMSISDICNRLKDIITNRVLIKDEYDKSTTRLYVQVDSTQFVSDLIRIVKSTQMRLSCQKDKLLNCNDYEIELNVNQENINSLIENIKQIKGVIDVRDNRTIVQLPCVC